MNTLLTRDEFRKAALERDGGACVVCKEPGQDVHHILERRLFPDEGYYIDNAATLCGPCHLKAEQTVLTCEQIREAAHITEIVLPPHLYGDEIYDKWGNIILPNKTRLKGELFFDESVQKVLASGNVLCDFTHLIKYPRTFHLPWSPNVSTDDRTLQSVDHFKDQDIVVTIKMDGENTTMYRDDIHARSLDGKHHVSRNWIKQFHAQIKGDIPEGWRFCGENLYAKHSIKYTNLKSYFYLFSIWDEHNVCLSWNDTVTYAKMLDLQVVPVIYTGNFNDIQIDALEALVKNDEGYVVRFQKSFTYRDFRRSVAKYVRKNHIQTSHNWMYEKIERNELTPD